MTTLEYGTKPAIIPFSFDCIVWFFANGLMHLQHMFHETPAMWKLIVGNQSESAHTGPRFPNASTNTCCFGGGFGGQGLGPCPVDDPCPPGGITACGTTGCLCLL